MAKQVNCRHHVELIEWKIKAHSHSSCFLVIYFNLFNKGRVICNICVYNHRSSYLPFRSFYCSKAYKTKKTELANMMDIRVCSKKANI